MNYCTDAVENEVWLGVLLQISAQESRRKKKEYMDALERKVELLSSENSEFRKKISNLEDTNCSLVGQLHKLQAIIARTQVSLYTRS